VHVVIPSPVIIFLCFLEVNTARGFTTGNVEHLTNNNIPLPDIMEKVPPVYQRFKFVLGFYLINFHMYEIL
jgi:hypothetical protein